MKEIGWALDFDKPIVIVVETENRFWPFDLKRWQTNQCTKAPDGSWTTGWLSRTYEQCPERIRTLVESQARNGEMLPFRRRDFELSALARKLVSRSFDVSDRIVWGEILPEPIEFTSKLAPGTPRKAVPASINRVKESARILTRRILTPRENPLASLLGRWWYPSVMISW